MLIHGGKQYCKSREANMVLIEVWQSVVYLTEFAIDFENRPKAKP
jgi:hypothetical protein